MHSEFMKAFEIDFIDSDFQEAVFFGKPIELKDLSDASYAPSFIHQLADIDFSKYNAAIIQYDFAYSGEQKQAGNLDFIGVFDYAKD
jgi:hypothetical protein